jgi:hypothetical protein
VDVGRNDNLKGRALKLTSLQNDAYAKINISSSDSFNSVHNLWNRVTFKKFQRILYQTAELRKQAENNDWWLGSKKSKYGNIDTVLDGPSYKQQPLVFNKPCSPCVAFRLRISGNGITHINKLSERLAAVRHLAVRHLDQQICAFDIFSRNFDNAFDNFIQKRLHKDWHMECRTCANSASAWCKWLQHASNVIYIHK